MTEYSTNFGTSGRYSRDCRPYLNSKSVSRERGRVAQLNQTRTAYKRRPTDCWHTISSSDLLNNKQALELIRGISLSPALQKSKDSILLAEDQYPDHLDSVFGKSDKASDLSRTISLLKWNRKTERESLERTVYDKMVAAQDSLRSTMQLTPTTDNPWEEHVYRDWKHRVTNICLTAVQEVM